MEQSSIGQSEPRLSDGLRRNHFGRDVVAAGTRDAVRAAVSVLIAAAVAAFAQPTVVPGTLPGSWITGGPNCLEVPDWQVHEYNPAFYILRESGCTNYEKPFLYLIFGSDRALLEDTGAGQVDTGSAVMDVVAQWAKRNKKESVPLIVTHSHGH